MQNIQNIATVTSKGQVTLPKPIRQALNIEAGSKLIFNLKDGVVILSNSHEDNESDPALLSFLDVIEGDIAKGNNLTSLNRQIVQNCASKLTIDDIENMVIDGQVAL